MAATTTRSINSLVKRLRADFPHLSFAASEHFAWNPIEQTVYYRLAGEPTRLLHELGHALLNHESYYRDIELVRMEADAWDASRKLAEKYTVLLSDEQIDTHMNTYRDWLHARSTCPTCDATGVQVADEQYRCLECSSEWRVNEARTCGLKRYTQ